MRWCARQRSRSARICDSRSENPALALEDLRAADQQYAALGLEFNRIDTNTALSQVLLGLRDVHGRCCCRARSNIDRQPHPHEFGEPRMARAISVGALRARTRR